MSKDSSYDVNKVGLVSVKNILKKIVTLIFVLLITFHISSCSTNVTNESTVKNNINSLNKSYNNMVKQYGLVFKNNKINTFIKIYKLQNINIRKLKD